MLKLTFLSSVLVTYLNNN